MAKPGKQGKYWPSPESSCLGKQKFSTLQAAAAASRLPIKKMKGRLKQGGDIGRLEAYKCHYCDGYHFGHPMRRKH